MLKSEILFQRIVSYKKMIFRKQIFIILLVLVPLLNLKAQVSYNDVKAVFIERFTRFIEWPAEKSMDDTTRLFKITVLNDKNFYNTLNNIYSDQKIYNKKVQVKHISNYKDIENCHLLFIGDNQSGNLKNILKTAQEKNILTISDKKGFSEKGVHINFFVKNEQIRFEINQESLKEAHFTVSYLLLNVAKIVGKE